MEQPLNGNTPGPVGFEALPSGRLEQPPVLATPAQQAGSPKSSSGEKSLVGQPPATGGNTGQVPFHPTAAALLVVVDNLWALEDWYDLTRILTVPLSFLSVAVPTYWLQRRFRQDTRRTAFLKALFFGVVAAVPTSVTGTPIGLALLAWAGVRRG